MPNRPPIPARWTSTLLAAGVFAIIVAGTAIALNSGNDRSPDEGNTCFGRAPTLVGTDADDGLLKGTEGADVILAARGADEVDGDDGNDLICLRGEGDRAQGGAGNDKVRGGGGEDTIFGDDGNDEMRGGRDDDQIFGNDGDDDIDGRRGADGCAGGRGRDEVVNCERRAVGSHNLAPVATNDSDTTDKHTAKAIAVLANDTDPDSDPLTVASIDTTGTQGTVTINAGGDGVTYDPAGHFAGLAPGATAHDTFTYKANDGVVDSGSATVDVTVTGINDPPAVTTSAGSTPYTEGDPATTVDNGVTVSDPDDANIESARVAVATGFGTGDQLTFTNQSGITGTYNSGTGVLTLTGTASTADYETALRSIGYRSTSDDPSASKAVEFRVNDGTADSNSPTKAIAVTPVNDAPTVATSGGSASFTENGPPAAVDPAVTASDPDSPNLQGATVSITANFSGADGDSLNFTNQNGISGSYNSGTGVLTLSGNASLANYQTALRSVTFSNTSDTPSTATRTVSFRVTDTASANSNTATRNVTVAVANDAPVVATTGGPTAATEDAPGVTIDNGLTVADPDDTNIESGRVRISNNFQSGDDLIFVAQAGITGTYDTGTGVLDLTGSATKSDYQTALRSIEFQTTNDDPAGSKTVEFKVNDGDVDSNAATKNVSVSNVNDAPTVTTSAGTAAYTEGGAAVAVDPSITATDPDSAGFQGAVVSITSNFSSADGDTLNFVNQNGISGSYNSGTGVLTLTGTANKANYQTALRSITFSNTSDNPSTATRTVSFKVTDLSAADSNTATRNVSVARTNDAPVVNTSAGSTAYTEGGAAATIDNAVTVNDVDDTNIESAQVRVSTGFQTGDALNFTNQNGISGSYTSGTGVLTLTGSSSVANYQTALRSIQFQTTNDNPSASKTVEFKVNDGDVDSNLATKSIAVTAVNDAPTLTASGGSASYTEGGSAAAIDSGLTVTDPDSAQLQGAVVSITSNFSGADGDTLNFVNQNGISGVYNSGTGVLTMTGSASVADYQTALRSITFSNTSDNPSTATRTVSVKATDTSAADSNTATRDVTVARSNDAPTVTASGGPTNYTEGGSAVTIDNAVTVTDPDDTNIESAQVRVSTGFQTGDSLDFTNQNGISGSYTSGTGVLTLTGSSSVANYQTAFRSIQFDTTNLNPGGKTIEFKANDGDLDSNLALKTITITGLNDPPAITTSGGSASFTEGGAAVAVDASLSLTDGDSPNLQGATVSITANFSEPDGDTLNFADQNGISGGYNSITGVLTLTGTDTVANYETALRSITFSNTSDTPSALTRTVSFQATDTDAAASSVASRDVTVTPTNDAPQLTTTAGSTAYTEGAAAVTIDSGVTVSDVDDTNLEGGRVRISSGFQSGDDLVFINQNGISGVYNTGTGVLTLSGTSSVANYETALQSIQFQSTNNNPVASKDVEFRVNDGDADSNTPTRNIAVTSINSAPVVDATNADLAYAEDDPATAVDSGLSVTEPEGDSISGASVSITTNYQAGQDVLSWTDNNLLDGITLDGSSTQQTIVLTGLDTAANYQTALRDVTYQNGSVNPSTLTRTVTFSATDTPGALTGSDTRNITVANVDDSPVAVDDSDTVLEDALATPIPVLTNDTDIDGGPKTITSATDPANGTVVLTGGSPGAHTGLTYQPDPNYCNDPPGTTPDTFTYTLNDPDPGPPGPSTATVSMTVTCVNDAPVADDETFNGNDSAHGNTTLQVDDPDDDKPAPSNPHTEIAGDILAGDTDVDSGALTVVSAGVNGAADNGQTNDGGTVTIESDGDFVFQPAASTSCTDASDFFDYKIHDSGTPDETDIGRVTIAIAGCVWYVSNNAAGNSGTSSAPFDTIAQAETASGNNHTVFVFDGDDTSTGYATGYAMNSGERLIGEHEGLVVDPDQGGSLNQDTLHPANAGAHPTLTATNEDVVELDDGNEVRGFTLDPAGTGSGIAGASGDTGGGTIDDVNIDDNGTAGSEPGLELDSTTGTFNISNLVVDNAGATSPPNTATGVRLNAAGTVNFNPTGQVSITTSGAKGLDASSTNMGSGSTFDDITASGSSVGGVSLLNTTGTTTFGDGTGTDLSLTTTSGSSAAFGVSSGGTVSVASAGSDNLSSTGGPALDVTSTSGALLEFDDVDSTSSAGDGINLSGLGTGSFSATTGTIAGAAGINFDLDGGSGAITYPGDLNNGTGQAAEITSRSGGAVSLSGPIADTSDAGGGILVSSNTGGSTTFSNGSKTINTTTSGGANNPINNAVVMNASDGHTLNLTGGGLAITTGAGTPGKGLEADTSGTITVEGSGNTITTTTGRALNISDTDIGSNDLTLQSISSNGASNGIRLNNTGSTGNLGVTGTGAAASGGTIQSSTDDGISVNNVGGGLSLSSMNLTSNGNANGDSGLDATGLTGTVALTSNNFTNNFDNNVEVSNSSGTLNATVSGAGSVYSGASGGQGDGIFVEGTGTGAQNLTVQGTVADPIVFANNADSHVQHTSDASNTTDSNVTIDHTDMSEPDDDVATQLGGGITINHGGTSNVDATITNNDIQNSIIGAIAVDTTGSVVDPQSADIDATIQSNTIGTAGDDGSGSSQGNGIFISSNGAGHIRTLITNNAVRQWTNRNGLALDVLDGAAQLDATVRANVFTQPNSAFPGTTTRGFTFQLGAAQAGDNIQACLDIGGTGGNINQVAGTGEGAQPDIRYLYEGPSTGGPSAVRLANYGGPITPTITDIANYLQPRNNTGGTPTVSGTATPTGSNSTTSVASCPLPAG